MGSCPAEIGWLWKILTEEGQDIELRRSSKLHSGSTEIYQEKQSGKYDRIIEETAPFRLQIMRRLLELLPAKHRNFETVNPEEVIDIQV